MKKLLGIVVLGLLLANCAKLDPTVTTKAKKGDQYKGSVFIERTGFNKWFEGSGYSRKIALDIAKAMCEEYVEQKGKGVCLVRGTYTGIGYNFSPNDSAPIKKVRVVKESSSSSGSKIDPSVWDDILGASQGILSGKSVSESLGGTSSSSSSSSSSISCFKKSERVSGTNKICTYNCMGSDIAINVKSTRLCPMSIKN